MPANSPAPALPEDAGFAGLRIHESIARDDWRTQDWAAFLGASYFRAIGGRGQYGLSARGIAVNTTANVPEEFPEFVELYLAPAATAEDPVRVYALLNGPSLAGAFQFDCHRGRGVRMEIDAHLFLRADVTQLGIAPLTSMFWFAEHNRRYRVDWRPEVHDSDTLAMWTGRGERLLRPLNNPSRVTTSSFLDDTPRGFGLLQLDRDFEHYLDGVNYERRPSLWVEPLDPWGKGRVQLVEIPTGDETNDNIAAFWVSDTPARAGSSRRYRYRLHWDDVEPFRPRGLGEPFATRIGRGGQAGKPRPANATKFVVEFRHVPRASDGTGSPPEAQLDASRGELSRVKVEAVPHTDRLRVKFDLVHDTSDAEPIELRLTLVRRGQALSETWLYQFEPAQAG